MRSDGDVLRRAAHCWPNLESRQYSLKVVCDVKSGDSAASPVVDARKSLESCTNRVRLSPGNSTQEVQDPLLILLAAAGWSSEQ